MGDGELLKSDILKPKRGVFHTSITVYVEIRIKHLIKNVSSKQNSFSFLTYLAKLRGERAYTLPPFIGIRITFAFTPRFCAMSDFSEKIL